MGWGDLVELAFGHPPHDLFRQGLFPRASLVRGMSVRR